MRILLILLSLTLFLVLVALAGEPDNLQAKRFRQGRADVDGKKGGDGKNTQKAPAKTVKKALKGEEDEEDDIDDYSDTAIADDDSAKNGDDQDDDDDDDEEDEKPKGRAPRKEQKTSRKVVPVNDNDEEDDDADDDDEDADKQPEKKSSKKTSKKEDGKAKKKEDGKKKKKKEDVPKEISSDKGVDVDDDEEADDEEADDEDLPELVCNDRVPCSCEAKTLSCHGSDDEPLTTANLILHDANMELEKALLANNHIQELRRGFVLRELVETLRELDLTNNDIDSIESGVFTNFSTLQTIKLGRNKLATYKKQWFSGAPKTALHKLYLDSNGISKLKPNSFDNLEQLRVLVLDGNPLQSLDRDIFDGLDTLEELSLDYCNLTDGDIPDNLFEKLPKLKKLSLGGNLFEEIPIAVTKVPLLEDLDLSLTSIVELQPLSFGSESHLKLLYMKSMPLLHTLNDGAFCGCDSLEELYLSNSSKLATIHHNAFCQLSDDKAPKAPPLKLVDLERTNVSSLCVDHFDMDKLTEVWLRGAPLDCTDCELLEFSKLRIVQKKGHEATCYSPKEKRGKLLSDQPDYEDCKNATAEDGEGDGTAQSKLTRKQRRERRQRELKASRLFELFGLTLFGIIVILLSMTIYHRVFGARSSSASAARSSNMTYSFSNLHVVQEDERALDEERGLGNDFQPRRT